MTDLELRIEVAKAMGYHVWWDEGDYEHPFMWLPLKGEYVSIPDWPEDLPACMRDLWPWLERNLRGLQISVCGLSLCTDEPQESFFWSQRPGSNIETQTWGDGCGQYAKSRAICHAVLAVVEKMKEGSNDSKG